MSNNTVRISHRKILNKNMESIYVRVCVASSDQDIIGYYFLTVRFLVSQVGDTSNL